MNLAATIEIHGGGPGSGCNPLVGHCGRPVGEGLSVSKPTAEERGWVQAWRHLTSPKKPNFKQAQLAAVIGTDAALDLEDVDTTGFIAKDKAGEPVGIVSLYDAEGSDWNNVTVNYLATSPLVIQGVKDDVHGVGTTLMREAARYAASKKAGVVLVAATPQAAAFYEKLGMHTDPDGDPDARYWTEEEVQQIAKEA